MLFNKLKNIKVIILDVDGVLTDGTVLVNEQGEQLRTFNVKDGYAMQLAEKVGLKIWVITGGKSEGVKSRLLGLGLSEVHLAVQNKRVLLRELLATHGISSEQALYVGDDMPDYEVMQDVELAVCPQDAVEEIKAIAHYMSPKAGGKGVVRDIIEKTLKMQGKWVLDSQLKSI
ncbi:KdsC family phosphatase [Sphingobacterium sp. HJSM2_6]|uniref:KdsC family phosphatase n=1 Tax=Sphingobacterium sp. HJSM2_6 TaxID=3366264 RepID=UPI003BC3E481